MRFEGRLAGNCNWIPVICISSWLILSLKHSCILNWNFLNNSINTISKIFDCIFNIWKIIRNIFNSVFRDIHCLGQYWWIDIWIDWFAQTYFQVNIAISLFKYFIWVIPLINLRRVLFLVFIPIVQYCLYKASLSRLSSSRIHKRCKIQPCLSGNRLWLFNISSNLRFALLRSSLASFPNFFGSLSDNFFHKQFTPSDINIIDLWLKFCESLAWQSESNNVSLGRLAACITTVSSKQYIGFFTFVFSSLVKFIIICHAIPFFLKFKILFFPFSDFLFQPFFFFRGNFFDLLNNFFFIFSFWRWGFFIFDGSSISYSLLFLRVFFRHHFSSFDSSSKQFNFILKLLFGRIVLNDSYTNK